MDGCEGSFAKFREDVLFLLFFSCFLINFGSALVFWPFLFYFVVRFTITGIAVY